MYVVQRILAKNEQMIVFAATQVEVQYLQCIFEKLNVSCTFLYSDMEPASRKINVAKFHKKITNVLLATDIAARGIDIPNLSYVLNFNFPGCAKTFIHRVGRAARQGKSGIALSFVCPEEEPYLWDLHKFLGRSVKFSPLFTDEKESTSLDMNPSGSLVDRMDKPPDKKVADPYDAAEWNYQFGSIPPEVFEDENTRLRNLFRDDEDVIYLTDKRNRANRLYMKSRPRASKVSCVSLY